ncbi:MAG TPA: glycosyltransferase [Steroidobacteraceae bacterium]|nr:glycosyltransferase [Steroidobacteraceae bacterium]
MSPRPLRILYHHRTQGRGAEGNHIVSIVTALRGLGHTVDVLSPPGVDPFSAGASVPVDKARTRTRGWASAWKMVSLYMPNWLFEVGEIIYNVPAFLRLRRALRDGSYDLVFERYAFYLVAGAIAARQAGCRFLLEANEACGIRNRARHQSFPRLCASFEKFLLRRCTAVHAVSSSLGRLLLGAGLHPARLAVVPNGFDVGRLRLARSREQMRAHLGYRDETVIGFAGWFDHWDRLDLMLQVFEDLRRTRPFLRLCLVGAGPAIAGLTARLESSPFRGDVQLTGAIPRAEVYDYIQTFDVGMLPHSNDFGSPIVMFEMMALRMPLVLPRLPPIEDVHEHGVTAELFTPLDVAEAAAALARVVDHPDSGRKLADAGYAMLTETYTWTNAARRILGRLDEATAAGPLS